MKTYVLIAVAILLLFIAVACNGGNSSNDNVVKDLMDKQIEQNRDPRAYIAVYDALLDYKSVNGEWPDQKELLLANNGSISFTYMTKAGTVADSLADSDFSLALLDDHGESANYSFSTPDGFNFDSFEIDIRWK